MDHKEAAKKVAKWILRLAFSVLGIVPMMTVLLIGGIVLAVFGTSSGSSASISSGTPFAVSDAAVYIWEYFTSEGYTEVQTAAILGNLQWESRLDYSSSSVLEKGGTARGIAQWTTYSGTNVLERYAEYKGMDWDDPELQCLCIDETLHGENPFSNWYDTRMGRYYGVTKADFWDGDLYDATMSFFCCFEDPEEYPDGCNNHGFLSAASCLTISFDCGNGHGRYPYAQAYLSYFTGSLEEMEEAEEGGMLYVTQEVEGGMDIPHYIQGNYASVAWGDTNLAKSGCGPTSLAMVMSYLLDQTITPADMIAWSGTTYLAATGSAWEFFPAAAKHYGVSYRKVYDRVSVDEALEADCPVIAREQPGSFFSELGHFVVIRGHSENGLYLVNDPAARYPVNREFTWEEINRPGNFYMIFGG